jgi:uncharacterized protein YheU (UPF0270 family)
MIEAARFDASCYGRTMTIHKIPVDRLSPEALRGIVEEFISRDGTDYGAIEASRETKFAQVKGRLASGSAILVFDDETETTNIFLANDPVLRKLDAVARDSETDGP